MNSELTISDLFELKKDERPVLLDYPRMVSAYKLSSRKRRDDSIEEDSIIGPSAECLRFAG